MEIRQINYQLGSQKFYQWLHKDGVHMPSRNGPVIRAPEPVTFFTTRPWEMVNTSPVRDSNPFFHLLEAMAMLGDINDVNYLSHFAKNMANFSDNGTSFNSFYGTRLRTRWGDQLDACIDELTSNPESRQVVAQIWDAADLTRFTKDKACNLLLMFEFDPFINLEGKRLRMTSINRSNDAVWGIVSGANVVHFALIHQYVAHAVGAAQGMWTHFTNNAHVYTEMKGQNWETLLADHPRHHHLYDMRNITQPLFYNPRDRHKFDANLCTFHKEALHIVHSSEPYRTVQVPVIKDHEFVSQVVMPMFNGWQLHKQGRTREGIGQLNHRPPHRNDWHIAGARWLERRVK